MNDPDIEYAVYRNSLVYFFTTELGTKRAGILRTYELGINDSDVLYVVPEIYGKPIPATKEDFDHYRVCPPKELFI